jgi:hypothetical protein
MAQQVVTEEYQSASAVNPASNHNVAGVATLTPARDTRLGVWITNGTPNSFCWISLQGGSPEKYQGFNVTPNTPFYTNLYLGEISARAGINPVALSNAVVEYNGDFNTILLHLTTYQPHGIPLLVEDTANTYNPPVTNEVRVYGTQRKALDLSAPVYQVISDTELLIGAFAFTTISANDNGNGTWTIESNIPHRFDSDGQSYYISNGSEYAITSVIDETHYTITGGSAVTGTIWPAPGFVSGWAQDQQPVRIGIMEI